MLHNIFKILITDYLQKETERMNRNRHQLAYAWKYIYLESN